MEGDQVRELGADAEPVADVQARLRGWRHGDPPKIGCGRVFWPVTIRREVVMYFHVLTSL